MAGNSFADALVKAVTKLAPKQYKTESGAIDSGRIIRDNTMSVSPATQSARPATQSISTPVLNSATGNATQSGGRPASSSNRGASVPASVTSGPARVTDGPATVQTPELDSAVGKPENNPMGEYADILTRPDYASLSAAGESKTRFFGGDRKYDYINNINNARVQEQANAVQSRGSGYGKYDKMTADQIGVYNYLYASQGKDAAEKFLSTIESGLTKQQTEEQANIWSEWERESTGNKILGSALTVAAQPIRTTGSILAAVDDAARTAQGREIDPNSRYRMASNLSENIRETAQEDMGTAGRIAYNAVMSGADNLMNLLYAQGLGGAVGATGSKAISAISSALMSSEVMANAVAEGKEKGYSNEGAMALGLLRGGISYGVEKMGMDWVFKNIRANPGQFLKTMMLNALPEGLEELAENNINEGANYVIDRLFGTNEYYVNRMADYYRENGTDWQKEHPLQAALAASVLNDLQSFATGALSAFGSTAGGNIVNAVNYNAAASALNTTTAELDAFMRETGLPDAKAVQSFAEANDVNNLQDLKEIVSLAKAAAEVADASMAAEHGTQLNAPQPTQESVSQPGQAETPTAPTNAQNAAQARVTEILSGTVSNSKAEAIINDPELRAAFEEMSGQELTGTKSEQRKIVKDYAEQRQAADESESTLTPIAQTALGVQQNTVDNAESAPYTISEGRDTDGLDEEAGGTLRAESDRMEDRPGTPEGRSFGQGDPGVPSGNGVLSPETRAIADARGIVNAGLHDSTEDNASFSAALDRAKANDPAHGCSVDSHSAEDLDASGTRTWLADNGMAGVAVEPNGNITAVFNNPANPVRGVSSDLILTAIENGGNKLDCFVVDGPRNLSRLYSASGFVPVAWMKFDHATWQKYHPGETWNFETMGEPIVAFFVHNGDSAATIASNIGDYEYYSSADIQKNFPELTDYDDGLRYQEARLTEIAQQRGKGNQAPPAAPGTPPTGQATAAGKPGTTVNRVQPGQGAPDGSDGTKLSAGVKTVQGARVTTDEMNALIGKTVSEGGYRYMPITNNATVQKATARIQRDGWTKARADWTADVRQGKTSAEMMAVGALLYNNAVNAGDMKAAAEIMADYIAAGTNTAQALQARQIIQSMQPEVRLYMIEQAVAKASEDYGDKIPDGVTISEDLKEEYRKATTEEERNEIVGRMQEEVAKQLPSTLEEKWRALRYLNMLGNLKTQGRNIAGNTAMGILTSVKDAVRNTVELAANKLSGGKVERTTMLGPVDTNLVQAARDFYDNNAEVINGERKFSDEQSADSFLRGAEEKKRIFRSKILEGMRRLTNWAMEKGDTAFIRGRFSRDLAKYLQVNGMDAATFTGIMDGSIEATEAQQALIERAVNNATKEAQEATFHDNNAFSTFATNFLRGDKTPAWAKVIAEGIMPFRKTPANVLVRAEEYSPLGFANAVYTAIQAKKGADGVTANDVINQFAKALTGSGLLFLGMALRRDKWLTGDEDDEKQVAFDKLRGGQQYALTFPDGRSFTMDWLAPAVVPVFLGAQLWDAIQDGGLTGGDALEIATHITNPLIQMSMLQGVNDALDNIKYSDNNLVQFALNSVMSYLTQGLGNTLLGQAEKTFSGDRRTETFVDADTPIEKWWQRQRGKLGEKIPFTDYNQVEYLDAWGRPQMNTENLFVRALENFASPGYVGQNRSTEVDDELQRLYDAGAGNVFPQRISMTDKINVYDEHGQVTEQRHLTADEYVQVQRQAGQTKLQMVKDLMASPVYEAMSDTARADAISAIYSYANHQALRKVEQSMANSYADVAALSNPAAYFATSALWNDAAENRWSRNYDELDDMMESYQTLAPDVRAAIEEKEPTLAKVYGAYQRGVSAETWFSAYDATKDLPPTEGHVQPTTWQKCEYIAGRYDAQTAQALMSDYLEDGMPTRFETAMSIQMRPDQFAAYYHQFTTTTAKDETGKSVSGLKKKRLANWAMEQGYSKKQADYLYDLFSKKLAELSGLNAEYGYS